MVSKKYLNSKLLGELSHSYFKNKLMCKSEYRNVKVSQITAASKGKWNWMELEWFALTKFAGLDNLSMY